MSMTHVDNMTTNVWSDIAFEAALDQDGKLDQNLFDSTIKELKDEYINKLKAENEKLRECITNLIEATEYGVNQWQAAWSPDEETKAQKVIRMVRKALKELEDEK